jgi:hypothetical protein
LNNRSGAFSKSPRTSAPRLRLPIRSREKARRLRRKPDLPHGAAPADSPSALERRLTI